MNKVLKSLGLVAVAATLTIFSANAFADDYESAVERGFAFDEEIQELLDADKG